MIKTAKLLQETIGTAIKAGIFSAEEVAIAERIHLNENVMFDIARDVDQNGLFIRVSQVKSPKALDLFGQLAPSVSFNEIELLTKNEMGEYSVLVAFRISDKSLSCAMMKTNSCDLWPVTFFEAGSISLGEYQQSNRTSDAENIFNAFHDDKNTSKLASICEGLMESGSKLTAEQKMSIKHALESISRSSPHYAISRFNETQHAHYVDACIESANAIRAVDARSKEARIGSDTHKPQDLKSVHIESFMKGFYKSKERAVCLKAINLALKDIVETYGLVYEFSDIPDGFSKKLLTYENERAIKKASPDHYADVIKTIKGLGSLQNEMLNTSIISQSEKDFLFGGAIQMVVSQRDFTTAGGMRIPQADVVTIDVLNAFEEDFFGQQRVRSNDCLFTFSMLIEDLILAVRGLNSNKPIQVSPSLIFGFARDEKANGKNSNNSIEIKELDQSLMDEIKTIEENLSRILDKKGALNKAEKAGVIEYLNDAIMLEKRLKGTLKESYEDAVNQINEKYIQDIQEMIHLAEISDDHKNEILSLVLKK